ncbi:MAG TPA: SemiSWEET transporter [Steroidobacteraceae bacterium]|nr:SemiSWEET transporter [Steroidobacteraceae bacterium]
MFRVDPIGYLAATLTTIAFVPQAIKVLKDRDTRSLSLGMYLIFTAGVLLWAIYGALRRDWAIVTANVVTSLLSMAILVTKIRYDGLTFTSGSSEQ